MPFSYLLPIMRLIIARELWLREYSKIRIWFDELYWDCGVVGGWLMSTQPGLRLARSAMIWSSSCQPPW